MIFDPTLSPLVAQSYVGLFFLLLNLVPVFLIARDIRRNPEAKRRTWLWVPTAMIFGPMAAMYYASLRCPKFDRAMMISVCVFVVGLYAYIGLNRWLH